MIASAPQASSDSGRTVGSVARTHVGRIRQINEDRLLALPDRGLWAIADGMGGHSGGDIAAEQVIASLQDLPARASGGTVAAALSEANRAIYDAAAGSAQMSGSTVVALSLIDDKATILWAGDSRCYRLRRGVLAQLTRDHSVVQDLMDAGVLAPERAQSHPQAHIITRALGTAETVFVDSVQCDVQSGDTYLLCSDGLSREIEDAALRSAMMKSRNAADMLMAAALGSGGRDNISLIIITID